MSNNDTAEKLDMPRQIVSEWRKRFFEERLEGLRDRPGRGSPRLFPPQVIIGVKAMAREFPSQRGFPLSRLSVPELTQEVITQRIVGQISDTTIWRWLKENAIRAWNHGWWVFPRDPQFREKVNRVLDLYAALPQGKPLKEHDSVLSADEKTSIQARGRLHESGSPVPGRPACVDHEYERGGAVVYLAAWDVRQGKIFGRCEKKSGIGPCDRFVDQVIKRECYRT